jgi:RHS repeat-associated protein
LLESTNPIGTQTINEYFDDGQLKSSKVSGLDSTNTLVTHETKYKYDGLGRHNEVIDALGYSTRMDYDLVGNVMSTTDANGHITSNIYDSLNRKTQTVTPVTTYDILNNAPITSNLTTRYTYDKNSNVISTEDPLGRIIKNTYDALNRRVSTTNAFGTADAATTKYSYDGVGNVITTIDANNHPTYYEYDAVNRQNKVTDALGKVISQTTYDAFGRVVSSTNTYGETTTATYNDPYHTSITTNSLGTSSQQTDAYGNVVSTTDALGRTNTYVYDKLNRRIKSTDYRGGVVIDAYDSFNNLALHRDASLNLFEYQYDKLDRLTNTKDSIGQISSIVYDNVGNKTDDYLTVNDGDVRHNTYAYDELNRQYSMTSAVGSTAAATMRTGYDQVGNVIGTKDALGRVTKSTYDNLNRQTAVTQAFGTSDATTTLYTYDKVGNRLSETNGRGYKTEYKYDELNRQIEMRDPYQISDPANDPPTRTEYFDTDPAVSSVLSELALGFGGAVVVALTGKVIKTTDALNHATYTLYDRFDRQIATYDATKHRTSATEYDAVDRVIAATDTFGKITTYTYQDALRKKITVDALGLTTTETTDKAGNVIEVFDSLHPATAYLYDKRNRQTKITDAEGGVTEYEYYLDNQTKSVTDAAPTPNETEYFYDPAGRLIQEKSVLGSRYYQYDLVNNRTQGTDRIGRVTRYDYDNLNRVKSETWLGGNRVFTYTYDKNSNLLSADDGKIRYEYAYDQTDLLEGVDRAQAGKPTVSFDYDYDNVGNLTSAEESIANNIRATTIYKYDSRNLNTEIVQTGAGLANKKVKFTYDAAGLNTIVERYVDGLLKVTTTNAFDPYGRLTGITQANGTGVISNDLYDLDILDRLKTETVDGQSRSIVYDNTDQVKTVTGSNTEGYTYDKNGNRSNTGYVTGSGNRLLSDGVYTYAYDAEGNRTKRTKIADNTVDNYTWDYRNRLVSIVTSSAGGSVLKTVGYEYDVDDQRVKKTVDGVVENYFIDRNQIAFVTDGSGVETFHYLYGLNVDSVMAQDSSTGMLWSLADRLGSIDTITDAEGVVVDKRSFDSFGRILSETNPSVSFRYGYTARELDLESGLNYYRARYYDSNVGRFISVDPLGFGAGDTNLYRYVGNNSTNAIDPSGLLSWEDVGNYAYGGLVNTDKFVAGFADKLTGGYTTRLREQMYGDKVAGQHEGLLFNVGQSVGLATGLVTIGLATGGAGSIGGGLDLGVQLWQNGGDFSQVKLDSIAISAVSGKIGASVSSGLGKGGSLVAGTAFAETGLGLAARTGINAGVGFNVGYWGKVTENALRGEELTNGAWQTGAFGAAGAAAGELLPAAANGIRKGTDELLNPAALTGLDDWLAAGSKGGLRRNFGAVRANSFKNNSTVFYHGSGEAGVNSILENGIDIAKYGRFNADFGRGFYMTNDKALAGWTTRRLSGVTQPSFATFRVGNKKLETLSKLEFNNPSSEWADFVTLNKDYIGKFTSETSQLQWMHGGEPYDMVTGPFARITGSNDLYKAWYIKDIKGVKLKTEPIQVGIHTENAVNIFNQAIRR